MNSRHAKIVIVDYGVGNVHSVSSALSFLSYRSVTTRDRETIRTADAYILPGVGAFGQAMMNLKQYGLIDLLNEEVCTRGKPILGICLGMQILGHSSEESPDCKGLGWIDYDVIGFPSESSLKIPHVGWNTIRAEKRKDLFKAMEREPHFYFDHSYYADCADQSTIAICDYGVSFPAVVGRDNIVGVQFHPEKSQVNGLKLFRSYFNFWGI